MIVDTKEMYVAPDIKVFPVRASRVIYLSVTNPFNSSDPEESW